MTFDSYGAFADWCQENNFDSDKEWDIVHEPHKRDLLVNFYIKHNDKDIYRFVNALVSNDWGWSDVEVSEREYERKTEEVVTEKVSYV